MALHLNLYHEIHRQSERERRDPVKLAMLAGLVLAVLLALWYFYRLNTVGDLERKRSELQAMWTKLEPQMKAAVEIEPELLARQKSNQALVERIQQRFYWGPFLEKIATLTPEHIQILAFTGTVEPDKEVGKAVTVLVRGVAAGVQPRTSAEDFRRSLLQAFSGLYGDVSAGFDANSLEDGVENVQLRGQNLGTATFRIRLQIHPASPTEHSSSAEPGKSK